MNWNRLEEFEPRGVFHSRRWIEFVSGLYKNATVHLVESSSKAGGSALPFIVPQRTFRSAVGISLPFSDFCGVLGSTEPTAIADLLGRLVEFGKLSNWRFLEVRLPCELEGVHESLVYSSHCLDVLDDGETQFKLCSSSVRRAVRKARYDGVQVEFLTGRSGVRAYYDLHCLTRRRHGLPPQPQYFFDRLADLYLDGKSGFVSLARRKGVPLAAAVFLTHGDEAVYKYAASDNRHQQFRGMNLVIWDSICRIASQGVTSLHFGRSSLNNPGLIRFKQSWGATEGRICNYRFDLVNEKWVRMQDRATGWYTSFFRFFPVAVLRKAGELLYRYRD